MKITILSAFPEMFEGFTTTSIIKKAVLQEFVSIELVDVRSYTQNKHLRIDDTPYGGGAGMVMFYQPLADAIREYRTENSTVILLTPTGHLFSQNIAHKLKVKEHLILVCGHYEGYDERILQHVDHCLSIGDYVLTGGELAAMVVSDAVIRLIDGVIAKDSLEEESFEDGLLEYPQYTNPPMIDDLEVPEVLLSGHHENIRKWRLKESLRKTISYRSDLLADRELNKEEEELLKEILTEKLDFSDDI